MNPCGGPSHPFPRANGGPEDKNKWPHPRRGVRRPSRPPARVLVPLITSHHHSFGSFTTSRSTHQEHHSCSALEPITRFCHPQDPRMQDKDIQPTSALTGNKLSRQVMLLLQDIPSKQREQLVWDIYEKFQQFINPRQAYPSPWVKVSLFSEHRGQQREVLLYNPATRYQQEFEEEEELGYGGFGQVVRARNRLDRLRYAIKMIIMNLGDSSLEACVQEVRALAELDHPHVVRYYTAWVQPVVWPQHSQWASAMVRKLSSDSSGDSSARSSNENCSSPRSPPAYQEGSTPSDDSVVFQDTGPGEAVALPLPPITQASQQQSKQTQSNTSSQESAGVNGSLSPYKPQLQLRNVLYIQMRLCGQSLRKWMNNRNASKSPVIVESGCLRIYHQVVEAVCYIHQKGFMHRDIKPANIFFTVEGGDIQLGDLGLARMVAHPLSASPAAPHTSLTSQQTYTTNVGTPLYTAPEMMGGNYGPKTDMYSLGIILLELFMVFKTNCERNIVISNLKTNDDLDPELLHHWPLIARWIKRLIDKDPASRPTAQELLDSNLFPEPKPPPSPTTAITTIEETGAWGLGHHTTEAAAVTQSEFKSVNVVEINQIKTETCVDTFKTEKSVNNYILHIEKHLSKDEQIALLQEENNALKRTVKALEKDLADCKIINASRAAEK